MMRDAVEEARQNRLAWQQYERDLRAYEQRTGLLSGAQPLSFMTTSTCGSTPADPYADADASWAGQTEFAVPPDASLPTIQMEIDSLQLVGPEVSDIYYYESLATGTYAPSGGGGGGGGEPVYMHGLPDEPTIDDLIRAAAAGRTPYSGNEIGAQIIPAWVAYSLTGLAIIGWKAYRVNQSVERARSKSAEFYPNLAYQDTRRDAHRHILWSMMLRRWVGADVAKALTDHHEQNSTGPAHVMDIHNNAIGRTHRYHSFRGHWLWDRWDWNEWAVKVRNYVNDSANAEYIPEWASAPPTTEQAWAREACVPAAKYIYFAQ